MVVRAPGLRLYEIATGQLTELHREQGATWLKRTPGAK